MKNKLEETKMKKYTTIELVSDTGDGTVIVYDGFDKDTARSLALAEIRYTCRDVSTPATAHRGYSVSYACVEGREISKDEYEEVLLESVTESAYRTEKGDYVAFKIDENALEYGSITAEELRSYESWNDVPQF